MRGHKFICLVDPTYWLEGTIDDPAVVDQIYWGDDSTMECLTFAHSDMKDNLVTIDTSEGEHEFARTIDGKLYYISDWISKSNAIDLFEQTD